MENYATDTAWQALQPHLPAANRLAAYNLPDEYYTKIGRFQVHVDHYRCQAPKARLVLLHGVGGNGRLLSFIALPLRQAGYDVVCPDLPLYGYTHFSGPVSYEDWVQVGSQLSYFYANDTIPLFLFGLSAGGLLAYQIACRVDGIKGILATCILDQRNREITKATAAVPVLGALGAHATRLLRKPFGGLKIPMKMVARMADIANDRRVAQLLMRDRRSSGAAVPLSFLHGMLSPAIEIEPERFTRCPFLLAHPGDDRWTDISLSRLFWDRLACAKTLRLLPGAGHFPLEPAGLTELARACLGFLTEHTAAAPGT